MNASRKTLSDAEAIVRNHALMPVLEEWFRHDVGLCVDMKRKTFRAWLHSMLDYMAGCIGRELAHDPEPREIVKALCVNAAGVSLATSLANEARGAGFKSDTNCYVEDGVVYANVWLAGLGADAVLKRAATVADEFRKQGWSSEVWVDEEDAGEVTVNAQMDFSAYSKMCA